MANITERTKKDGTKSYLIRVFIDENSSGKQSVKTMTYTPPPNSTPKQVEKEVKKQADAFENKVKSGLIGYDASIKFQEYAEKWLENASLAPKTRERYIDLLKRINAAIGHIKLQNLQAHHLESFYKNLSENGVKITGSYAVASSFEKTKNDHNLTKDALAKMAGVGSATIGAATSGKHISIETAGKIAAALGVPVNKLFNIQENTTGLSSKTIHHHHQLIATILGKAKRERIIQYNVAVEHATAPKLIKKEPAYLDDIQAKKVVELLLVEPDIRIKTVILTLLYSGVRRGELCGLRWDDVDFEKQLLNICRASQYQRKTGIVTVPTKNENSVRTIKLPAFMLVILSDYKKWWCSQRLAMGSKWEGTAGNLFVQETGKPINPDSINGWVEKFRIKHNLPYFTPHSLRHTFATLQIMAGVDIRTVQGRTGHAQASTLLNIYSHAIKSANELASDALDNILTPKMAKENQA